MSQAVGPYYPCRHTRDYAVGRYVVRNDRASTDYCTVTDGDTWEDHTMRANPNIVLDDNRPHDTRPVHHQGSMIVRQGCNGDMRCYHDPVPDLDAAHPMKLKESAN
jgi:hypothetical protein